MKAQWITFSLILLGAVGLFLPRQNGAAEATPVPAVTDTMDVEAGEARRSVARMQHNGSQTTLARDADGHFYAEVRIDGRPVEMLVDTGASFIALTREDADAAGVDWREDDAVVVGQGAGGPVRGVPVTLDEVDLGGHRARDVRAAVIVDGLQVSLLGQSFLGEIEAMRIEGDRMVLGKD